MRDDVAAGALPLDGPADLDPLLDRIGDARVVMLGEASHGTHEYYAWRTEITRRLVAERDASFVAVEGDWPDCSRVGAAVRALPGAPADPAEALRSIERWPTWMWANDEVVELTRWLRELNVDRPREQRVGFYGLDVYSLWDSLRAVVDYLRENEPGSVRSAIDAFRCFEPYAEDPQRYARATRLVPDGCEDAVVEMLATVRGAVADGAAAEDGDRQLDAEQNAHVAAGAEAYYRAMVHGGPRSWNVRDTHMADTLDRLLAHQEARTGRTARAVVWAHNTHVGDARFTDMTAAGLVNLGQLARERRGEHDVALVGFGSHRGSVVAARAWGDPAEVMTMPPARTGSLEAVLHDAAPERALFTFGGSERWWEEDRDHRAIGVVYHPEAERWGNYVPTVLGRRYDAFVWMDRTRAVTPLRTAGVPVESETWPTGL